MCDGWEREQAEATWSTPEEEKEEVEGLRQSINALSCILVSQLAQPFQTLPTVSAFSARVPAKSNAESKLPRTGCTGKPIDFARAVGVGCCWVRVWYVT